MRPVPLDVYKKDMDSAGGGLQAVHVCGARLAGRVQSVMLRPFQGSGAVSFSS